MTAVDNEPYVSILLDIKQEIGVLNAQVMEAARSRQRLEDGLIALKDDVAEIKPVIKSVAVLEPKVKELMDFKTRIGAYVWLGGTLVAGAVYLLWQGVVYFSAEIKAWIK